MALKAAQIKGLTCPQGQKQKKEYDSNGLYLLIKNTGGQLWRFRYKYGGKHKEMALGKYPSVTLGVAREKAEAARSLLANGIDPMFKRKTTKHQSSNKDLNFGTIAKKWFELNQVGWSGTYQDKLLRWLKVDLKHICGLKIDYITKINILDIIDSIVDAGHKKKAYDVFSVLRRIFLFATSKDFTNNNPTLKIDFKTVVGILPPVQNLPAIIDSRKLGQLICDIDNSILGTFCTMEALKLIPRVFLRPSEVRNIKWEYIDFDKRLIYMPAEVMKSKRDHIVPMSKQVIKQLEYVFQHTNYSKFVFPSERSSNQPISKNVLGNRLKALGYDSTVMVAHGFRSTASTLLSEAGVEENYIETQLAHLIGNATSRVYNRAKYLPQRKVMMQKWSDTLDSLRDKNDQQMIDSI
jgi:integrase